MPRSSARLNKAAARAPYKAKPAKTPLAELDGVEIDSGYYSMTIKELLEDMKRTLEYRSESKDKEEKADKTFTYTSLVRGHWLPQYKHTDETWSHSEYCVNMICKLGVDAGLLVCHNPNPAACRECVDAGFLVCRNPDNNKVTFFTLTARGKKVLSLL